MPKVRGGKQVRRNLKTIRRNIEKEAVVIMDQNAEDLLRRARGLAPQLSSDLILSGDIFRKGTRSVVRRVIFFDTDYSVVMHEDRYNLGPVSSLKKSPDGPIGRKYLSRPFQARVQIYQENLQHGYARAIRQSVR